MFTVLLREPRLPFPEHTVCLSVSISQAIESVTPLSPAIKWPNDLLIADRKVCGVLAESTDAAPGYVAVGLGLNAAWGGSHPRGVPSWATALDEHLDGAPDRSVLLQETIMRLDEWLLSLQHTDAHTRLRAEWQRRLWRLGQPVEVKTHEGVVHGVLGGTDDLGALMLIADSGDEIRVLDGELVLPGRP
jgi:BirA family biotin operon repressor/biotin-[acetyl-CoA-carboxylase] ligase